MTYNITYLLLVLLLLVSRLTSNTNTRSVLYFLALGFLFAFAALRYEVGCDYDQYRWIFLSYINKPISEILFGLEPLYYLTSHLVYRAGLPYMWINVICSFVFFLGLHAIAKRQPLPLALLALAFPILIVNMPMSAVRQSISIGIMCFAYLAFSDQQPRKFVLLTVLASLFHTSAIVFILLWPLARKGLTKKAMAITALLAIPSSIFILNLEGSLHAITRHILDKEAAVAFGAPIRLALLSLTGLLFLRYFSNEWKYRYDFDYDLVKLGSIIMISIPVFYAGSYILSFAIGYHYMTSVTGDRFGYYLVPLQLIILARLPMFYRRKITYLLRVAPYIFLGLILYTWTQISTIYEKCYSPYQLAPEITRPLAEIW